ncbi:efflux RND transporter periplasmic adaptor subunit [bacterium]|nr:efflux RND transporter periplasmic adaptor subunit [bacterium]
MQHVKQDKKNKNVSKIILPILLLLLIYSSFMFSCEKNVSAPETAVALRGDIVQSIDSSGNVDSVQSKNLSLPSSGKVLKSVEKGDAVKKDSILIEIDNRKTKLLTEQAKENIKVAESSLRVAKINYKGALDANHIAVQAAQKNNELYQQLADNAHNALENTNILGDASIESAATALQNAQNSFNTSISQAQQAINNASDQLRIDQEVYTDPLSDSRIVADENALSSAQVSYNSTLAAATASINSATAALNSAEEQARLNSESAEGAYAQALINQSIASWNNLSSLEQAGQQISATLESINTAEDQVNLAKINLDIASLELENSTILMPFNGLVQTVNVREGEYLSPAMIAVTVISNEFVIKTDIEETDIGKIKKGQEVDITLDAYPDEKIKGVVDNISPISKNTAGVISFQVTIKPEEAKIGLLMFGISANTTIYTDKIENVILVPSLSVFEENNKSYVWVLNENKESVKTEVTTGASDFENIEIRSGLKEGDEVLLSKPDS